MLLASAWVARRAPGPAFGTALGIWLSVQIGVLAAAPAMVLLSFLSVSGIASIFAKVVVLFMLARGLLAARRVETLRAEIASLAPGCQGS